MKYDDGALRSLAKALLPDAVFQSQFEHVMKTTLDLLSEETEFLHPAIIIGYSNVVPGGKMEARLSARLFSDMDLTKRYETMREMGAAAANEGLDAHSVFVVTESWKAPMDEHLDLPPSEHPQRSSCITIVGIAFDKRSIVGWIDITRDENDFIVTGKQETGKIEADEADDAAPLACAFFVGFTRAYRQRLLGSRTIKF